MGGVRERLIVLYIFYNAVDPSLKNVVLPFVEKIWSLQIFRDWFTCTNTVFSIQIKYMFSVSFVFISLVRTRFTDQCCGAAVVRLCASCFHPVVHYGKIFCFGELSTTTWILLLRMKFISQVLGFSVYWLNLHTKKSLTESSYYYVWSSPKNNHSVLWRCQN